MTIHDLDHDEGMLLLRYRLLSPDRQKELLQQLDDLTAEKPEAPTDSPINTPTD
ncbi:MAG: hypothetical protein IJH07_02840 [Ruminococcus sp.]|nr:hypothetical protein [Ruminococcus sp.]